MNDWLGRAVQNQLCRIQRESNTAGAFWNTASAVWNKASVEPIHKLNKNLEIQSNKPITFTNFDSTASHARGGCEVGAALPEVTAGVRGADECAIQILRFDDIKIWKFNRGETWKDFVLLYMCDVAHACVWRMHVCTSWHTCVWHMHVCTSWYTDV